MNDLVTQEVLERKKAKDTANPGGIGHLLRRVSSNLRSASRRCGMTLRMILIEMKEAKLMFYVSSSPNFERSPTDAWT